MRYICNGTKKNNGVKKNPHPEEAPLRAVSKPHPEEPPLGGVSKPHPEEAPLRAVSKDAPRISSPLPNASQN